MAEHEQIQSVETASPMYRCINEELVEAEMDDEEIRTHRYWQKWGKHHARDIVKIIQKENFQSKRQRRKELVYSARTRESRYELATDSDTDATEISLLTCSSLNKSLINDKSVQRQQTNKKKTIVSGKPNWEKFASRRPRGLIDKLMAKDASVMSAMVGGDHVLTEVVRREQATDYMSQTERDLLHRTGYSRGLYGTRKADSTENVILMFNGKQSAHNNLKQSKNNCNVKNEIHSTKSSDKFRKSNSACQILQANNNREIEEENSKVESVFMSRHSAKKESEPDSVKKYQKGLKALPDFEGKFSKAVRQKIQQTVSALHRSTGHGDSLYTVKQPEKEKGFYTKKDYAYKPMYPQRVLIAPELSKVIRKDIKKRMGRPRYHEIKQKDIVMLDNQNPPLNIYNRNLIIFNWLSSIDEENYDMIHEPIIPDMEEDNYTFGHIDSLQRAATAMSRITNALDDCSTLKTPSEFTTDISGFDDSSFASEQSFNDVSCTENISN